MTAATAAAVGSIKPVTTAGLLGTAEQQSDKNLSLGTTPTVATAAARAHIECWLRLVAVCTF